MDTNNIILKQWHSGGDYGGTDYSYCYCVIQHNRDSDLLTESNWYTAEKLFKDEFGGECSEEGEETWFIARFNHWACGWLEMLFVPIAGKPEIIEFANNMALRLEDYPILDDDDYYQRENDAIWDYWKSLSYTEKRALCKEKQVKYVAGDIPEDLYEYLRDIVQ